jgi:hypothetical protein
MRNRTHNIPAITFPDSTKVAGTIKLTGVEDDQFAGSIAKLEAGEELQPYSIFKGNKHIMYTDPDGWDYLRMHYAHA